MDFDQGPILVFWETTRACGLACRHCRATAMREPAPGQLSTREGIALLEDLTGFGPRPPVLILTGGDPLMRPDIYDLAARAGELGIPLGLAPAVTPLLDDAALDRLRSLGVRAVSISLDAATAATHEGLRQVPGIFEDTVEAIRRLVEAGFRVQVNTVVMRDTVEELPEVAALIAGLGAHIWEVFFLVKVGRGRGVGELSPRENEDVAHFLYEASAYGLVVRTVEGPFFRRVVAARRALGEGADPAATFGLGPLYQRLAERLRAALGPPVGRPRAQTAGTRDGRGIVFVAHDGEVYPAGFLPFSLGNVRTGSVVDIYRTHPMLRAIRRAEFGGRCGACEHRDLCGGSRARAFAAFGDPLAEDPACAYLPALRPAEDAGGALTSSGHPGESGLAPAPPP